MKRNLINAEMRVLGMHWSNLGVVLTYVGWDEREMRNQDEDPKETEKLIFVKYLIRFNIRCIGRQAESKNCIPVVSKEWPKVLLEYDVGL